MASNESSKKYYGLIGGALSHSFSRDFFNAKFQNEGIDAEYLNFELQDIGELMEVIAEYPELQGLNVTSPYKEQVLPYLDELDETAAAIQAVNVIKVIHTANNGIRLKGYNSDVVGFGRSIEPFVDDAHKKALVLGTGGASKAVTHALEQLGVAVTHVSRRKSQETVTYEELTRAMIQDHPIIVNATPLGKFPDVESCPNFPYRFLSAKHVCYDLVYNPETTLFMKHAQAHGAQVKNGLEMLLLQAFASWEFWNNEL